MKKYRIPWLVELKKKRARQRMYDRTVKAWLDMPLGEKRKHPDYFDLSECFPPMMEAHVHAIAKTFEISPQLLGTTTASSTDIMTYEELLVINRKIMEMAHD